jgi:hypothetical protein
MHKFLQVAITFLFLGWERNYTLHNVHSQYIVSFVIFENLQV